MAIFRNGVKLGKGGMIDMRAGLSKERGQGLMREVGLLEDDKGRKKHEQDARGEVQVYRGLVARGEGFQHPVNFKVSFGMPLGIDQEKYNAGSPHSGAGYKGTNKGKVKSGGLDWRTHIMNNSNFDGIKKRFDQAKKGASIAYKYGERRHETKLDLFCSKVSIPERQIQTGLYRQAGAAPFPFPQTTVYGAITTSFYCDGTMHIKNYFDAWQKLIHNDITGNFNFWDEYTADFDIHTRTTIASGPTNLKIKKDSSDLTQAEKISQGLQETTREFNEKSGVDNPRDGVNNHMQYKIPQVSFRENYGVRVFRCFPQIVGELALAHDAKDSILTFDVTWSYVKWNPFKMGDIGNRSRINLSVGEFRNEKDGFPFLEDLPGELGGPLTGAVNQGINTSPLSKASNLLG